MNNQQQPTIPQAAIDAATNMWREEDIVRTLEKFIDYDICDEFIERCISCSLQAGAPHILAANAPESPWQPIETCPRDGSPFLAYAFCGGYTSSDYRGNPYQQRLGVVLAGWNARENAVSINGVTSGELNGTTHWMPLPQPPKEA